ncbi:MAG: hypothetical protein Q9167_005840 [Letrouitia subvulpina]
MRLIPILTALLSAQPLLTHAASIPPSSDLERREPRREKKKQKGMPKYFHEPGGSDLGNHYDSRFEHGIQDYADKKITQLLMLRAYLTFFHDNHIETWLAHGTLLGWWWNGKMLPWDWDIDTQVSGSTLAYLGQHWNFTKYEYISDDDPPVRKTYLLDVNPASVERERGNGLNIIDARWIDIANGLYIDITGLSETHPDDQPGVWSCKNYHRYHTTDLYPMRETLYEGVPAKVPYAYDRILTQEYHEKALVLTEYEGHRWDPITKEWMKKSDDELAQEKKEKEAAKKEKQEKEKAEKDRKKDEDRKKKEEEDKKKNQEEQKKKDEDLRKKVEAERQEKLAKQQQQTEPKEDEKTSEVQKSEGSPSPPLVEEKSSEGHGNEKLRDQGDGTAATAQRLKRRFQILGLEQESSGLQHLRRR